MQLCISNAEMPIDGVEAISAWGPGHKEIDAMEACAINRVFGASSRKTPVCSIKGAIGNPFAAAGALQVAAAVFGLCESIILPTVNWSVKDPDCDLDLSNQPRFIPHSNVLVNAHGVSGTNTCVLIEKC
jgi:3-oxoacyl-(acyl-carrier-protein) synthase